MRRPTSKTPNHSQPIAAMRVFFVALMAYWFTGCETPLYTPAKSRTQAEAASTHLAVLSVARWDARKGELQPGFELKSEEALTKVMPTTFGLEEKLINALAAKLKVALPGTRETLI